jgi:signal transduction histidine kinase
MYKRLVILTVIIVGAFCGLAVLGYVAVGKWEAGLEGARLGQFAEVAEQVRQDVKNKLDKFMTTEQSRPYTDYQYYSLPLTGQAGLPKDTSGGQVSSNQQQITLQRSPLAGAIENSFATGYFQIEPGGNTTTINDGIIQFEGDNAANREIYSKSQRINENVRTNLLPILERTGEKFAFGSSSDLRTGFPTSQPATLSAIRAADQKDKTAQLVIGKEEAAQQQYSPKNVGKQADLPIESLKQSQEGQVVTQKRAIVEENIQFNKMMNTVDALNLSAEKANEPNVPAIAGQVAVERERTIPKGEAVRKAGFEVADTKAAQGGQKVPTEPESGLNELMKKQAQEKQTDTIQIRIEPFTPIVAGGNGEKSIFGGQIFFIRHIQIEDKHFVQGFKFNETKLTEAIEESAKKFAREGMGFELSRSQDFSAAYSATLDFGFGQTVLNFKELVPDWIKKDIRNLERWYFGAVVVVFLAVAAGLTSLWLNARAQLKLAEKKDDFISAVSHELRTPLTSIRMFTEMLQKGWVKSDEKRSEYYQNMQQESERLSRLVENVLDFSRIQKGRKKYSFTLGNINECVQKVVEMMRPYAQQRGFAIKEELGDVGQSSFDRDAVTQIVVNLIDNATKYARDAIDRTIIVRTGCDGRYTIIEVEDHGPGVPHRQRKKVFEEFYRIGSEATRETQGAGLGLALVKKFAEAHNGFAEILGAKPTGAIFRVCLAKQS